MAPANHGDTVNVHYTGKLEDDTIFDSSRHRAPLQFTVGQEQVLPDFEKCVIGMNSGETRVIEIAAKEAYGLHRDDLVIEAARDQFPEDLELEVGMQLQMEEDDGLITVVTVHELSDSNVTLDANHPLAGKDLTFEITLIDIESK